MEIFNKPDDGKQHRRQSKDVGEVVNYQTDMNVTDEDYDRIFHNWEEPDKCREGKASKFCTICDKLNRGETVIGPQGKEYKKE